MTKHYNLTENNEYWLLRLSNNQITRCMLDFAFSIQLFESNDIITEIRLENEIIFSKQNQKYILHPHQPLSLCPILEIVHWIIKEIIIFKSGKLNIIFENEDSLIVNPLQAYESWQITGPNKLMIICNPGGNISLWK